MTPAAADRRFANDRRRFARGGRRPRDRQGFAPLILVADDDSDSAARCEAILAALRFAVAPTHSAEEALRVMQALRPNLVVAHLRNDTALRDGMRDDAHLRDVPVLSVTEATREPARLVDEIRRVLRERSTAVLNRH